MTADTDDDDDSMLISCATAARAHALLELFDVGGVPTLRYRRLAVFGRGHISRKDFESMKR